MRRLATLLVLLSWAPSAYAGGSTRIARENALAGTGDWNVVQAPFRSIEGYTSQVSVRAGESIQFHVQTDPAAPYRIELYRLGWYGGLGGRLLACIPSCMGSQPGVPQPVPPFDANTGYLNAGWPVTSSFDVPATWVSGYYLAVLRLAADPRGQGAKVPFIVRQASAEKPSRILVQAPVNTWQAYNSWGGRSLYSSFDGRGSNHVSFDRPYVHGNQDLFEWEYQLVRWLEREGYDVSYTTSVDVDREPEELQRHRLYMAAGHDEYWTRAQRDALETARDAGTNLAFMGGNAGYWQIRYDNDRRTVVEYRIRANDPEPNPALKTTLFRLLIPPRPECTLLGVQWQQGIGIVDDYPVNDVALGDPWFAGTGFTAGSSLAQIVGGEWDGIDPNCPTPPTTTFFHYSGRRPPGPADTTRYVWPASGARVFHGGTLRFAWGLDSFGTGLPGADERLQRFMRNAIDDLGRPAAPTDVAVRPRRRGFAIQIERKADARVTGVAVYRHAGPGEFTPWTPGATLVCATTGTGCRDDQAPRRKRVRYLAIARDAWGASFPKLSAPVRR